jgi:uncharacterized membrane protein
MADFFIEIGHLCYCTISIKDSLAILSIVSACYNFIAYQIVLAYGPFCVSVSLILYVVPICAIYSPATPIAQRRLTRATR